MTGWLAIAGLGPGNPEQMTPEVAAALTAATDVVGYAPYLARIPAGVQAHRHGSDNREELDRARLALDLAARGHRVAVVSSGDPGVFAMASAVFEAVEAGPAGWALLEIRVLPGITAMLAAAARLGAPLGHDFAAINLSDNLKPWPTVLARVRAAAEAGFVLAFYNPRSRARPDGFGEVLTLLRGCCGDARPIAFARAVGTDEEVCHVTTLGEAVAGAADMRTVVIVGSPATRMAGRFLYTPRWSP